MRVFNDMTDIVLDAPNAYHTLSKFVERGAAAGFVSRQIAEELPSRYIHHMHTNIHTCMHTYIHTYLHTYIHTYCWWSRFQFFSLV